MTTPKDLPAVSDTANSPCDAAFSYKGQHALSLFFQASYLFLNGFFAAWQRFRPAWFSGYAICRHR